MPTKILSILGPFPKPISTPKWANLQHILLDSKLENPNSGPIPNLKRNEPDDSSPTSFKKKPKFTYPDLQSLNIDPFNPQIESKSLTITPNQNSPNSDSLPVPKANHPSPVISEFELNQTTLISLHKKLFRIVHDHLGNPILHKIPTPAITISDITEPIPNSPRIPGNLLTPCTPTISATPNHSHINVISQGSLICSHMDTSDSCESLTLQTEFNDPEGFKK